MLVMSTPYEMWSTAFFILAWVLIGSFVFHNIFTGVMVNNFMVIRGEVHWREKERKKKEEIQVIQEDFEQNYRAGLYMKDGDENPNSSRHIFQPPSIVIDLANTQSSMT